jgi:hypothetical protein
VLVVDGLDEGIDAESGGCPIASLLPKQPGPGLRVIVASRRHPPLPAEIPSDHPLRNCRIRNLDQSPHAREIEHLAMEELENLLREKREEAASKQILGLIASSGGGLTQHDLERLTGCDPHEVRGLLKDGTVRRVLQPRSTPRRADGNVETAYLFAHETLLAATEQALSADTLRELRERIHEWAAEWKARGWPDDIPSYLLFGYARMLRARQEADRLAGCATDTARHDRMLDSSGSDAGALAEIRDAQVLLLAQAKPDLLSLARLAIHLDQLSDRNASLPADLPAVWAALGRPVRRWRLPTRSRAFAGRRR